MSILSRRGLLAATAALGLFAAFPAYAADLVIGYQTGADPAKVAQADGAYEKATRSSIDWRKFDSGADVIAAIASGAIQIGYVGSSPLAAAASREVPIETIYVAALLGNAEALVVRNGSGIEKPADFKGKKIAVPFVSTGHYSLLAALKHWGVDPKSVEILNLRPPEIAAAFARGDIDAAYVWDPALGKIKETGKVLTSSAEVATWGAPTFDAWIVRKDYAEKHPEIVAEFVRVTASSYADYAKSGAAWTTGSPEVAAIARLTGAKAEEIPELLKGNAYPLLDEQLSDKLLGGGTARALVATAGFLKEQGRIDAVLNDYSAYVSRVPAEQAAKLD
ncbi:taurine ABC transporter substrate-binding protein [Ancylobacter sp. 6x-1]|uniref:Taurine ABC transporter substrate-binding protein n=1 Tax=Ancylobacter crimeensis TaxID=2579147 RepID=A0ABT0D5U3_9HYPH|nr:taurine ABC transporter substrate-binding protein [Ancylobacter crimeensis]MCK0195312.1 taurine ABC transporter substrate-binding protein [Ancylobacter crimeensis]